MRARRSVVRMAWQARASAAACATNPVVYPMYACDHMMTIAPDIVQPTSPTTRATVRPRIGRTVALVVGLVGWTMSGAIVVVWSHVYMGYTTGFVAQAA